MRIENLTTKRILLSLAMFWLIGGMFLQPSSGQAGTTDSHDVRLLQSDTQGIVLELEVLPYTVHTVKVDGQTYERIAIAGYGSSAVPGEPELPQRGILLGIPSDAEVSLSVLATESTVAERFYVCPVPEMSIKPLDPERAPLDQAPDFQARFVKDLPLYATNTFFPSVVAEVGASGYLRDQRYVQVVIHPVQYNPVTRELKHHHYIKLQISFGYPQGALSLTPSRAESPAFETVLQNSILNYEIAKAWRSRPQPKAQAMADSLDYLTPPSYKIPVGQDGIYQLTYTDTLNAGIDVASVDPRTFKLYNQGNEVAIYVEGEGDESFDPDDYILFYGQKINTKYTDTNVYWLTVGGTTGLRMPEKDGGVSSTASTPSAFKTTVHAEEDNRYGPSAVGEDHWYWGSVKAFGSPASADFTTSLSNIATTGTFTALMRVALEGVTSNSVNPDHHTEVYLNDCLIEDATWDGRVIHAITDVAVPQSCLKENDNIVKLELPCDLGIGFDMVLFNWFEIDYYDTYTAENDSLCFSGEVTDTITTWEYHVDGFTTNDVELFDIFDITEPAATTKIVSPTVESYTLKFEDTITERREYLALTTAQRLSPLSITLDTPSDLHSTDNGADYIIITHSDFYTDVLSLANHRATQCPRTMLVDVQDVYDEFSYGVFDAEAIHDFLAACRRGNRVCPSIGQTQHDY